MIYKGLVAFFFFSIIIIGNISIMFAARGNLSISPLARSDVFLVALPLTVAAGTSSGLFVFKTATKRIKELGEVNLYVGGITLLFPIAVFIYLVCTIIGLESDAEAAKYKKMLSWGEAGFGFFLALVVDQMFTEEKG